MRVVFVLLLSVALALAEQQTSYEGYKVYQVQATTDDQVQFLNSLKENSYVDFWSEHRTTNSNADIMVEPAFQQDFESSLALYAIPYSIMFDNVESAVKEERSKLAAARAKRTGNRLTTDQYYTYAEINAYLRQLEGSYPDLVQLETIGTSLEARDMIFARISSNYSAQNPIILIDGGIHAREWIAPAAVLYIIQELVENPANRAILQNVDFYILPVLNPDGYEYSRTNTRLWRKTRSQGGTTCFGVDGNRNFDYFWGAVGTSTDECSDIFRGPIPRSEIETRLFENFAIQFASRITLYLSFHSYGQYFLYPWGYTNSAAPNGEEHQNLGDTAAGAIRAYNSSTIYTVGVSSLALYPTAGDSTDWAYGAIGVPLTYTVELPDHGYGFVLPPEHIDSIVRETFETIPVFANHTRLWRKTRSHGASTCFGVDGNRNYDYYWGVVGTSTDECSDIFRGPIPNSEIETRLFENFAIQFASRIKLYLSFHSYGEYLLYPWGYINSAAPNGEEHQNLGETAAAAIRAYNSSTIYTVGVASLALYPTAGDSTDWAYGAIGVPLTYTVELPDHGYGFVLPPEHIDSVVRETFQSIPVFANHVRNRRN